MQRGEVYRLDELVETTGMPAARILTRMTELELLGEIATAGWGRYTRTR
jgi:predicted Rossmann fold nucleotide-binding protein DprA/Smf involved in DNA uptake